MAWPAPGPDQSSKDLTEFSLDDLVNLEVVSASKFSQRAADAPASVTILTAQEFRDYGWRTLGDALRSLRGIYVTSDRVYDYVGVRGFGRPQDYNTRLLVLVDGYRINDSLYDQGFVGTELPLDVDLIDRVEVIRGPSSSVYGSNAFFGVVNVVTRTAADQNGLEVAAAAGSAGTLYGRATFGRATQNGVSLLLSASGVHSDGETIAFADQGLTSSGADYLRDRDFLAKLAYGNLKFELLYGDRKRGVPGGQYGSLFDDPFNAVRDTQTIAGLTYDTRAGATDVSARLTYGRYEYEGTYAYGPPSYPASTPTWDQGLSSWWAGEVKGVRMAGERHKLVAGAEYQYSPEQNQTNNDPTTVFLDDRRHSSRYGAYLQDDFSVRRDVTISAGLRYDAFSNYASSLSPRLGLIWRQDPGTVWKLLYGSAFRAPNVYETYYSYPGSAAANLTLRPEKIRTYEAVLEKLLGDVWRLSGTVYHYDIQQLIDAVTDPVSGVLQYQNVSQAKATGAGIEAEAVWKSGIRTRASYAYQVAEDGNGVHLTNSPRSLVKLNVSAPISRLPLRAGFEAQYMSSRTTALEPIGHYVVANLTLTAHELVKGLDLSASVYNLFDQTYFDPATLDGVHGLMPQPGRAFRLKAVYRF